MVFLSVIQKTVSLSPKLAVPISIRGLIGTSRGSFLLAHPRSYCVSISEIHKPDEVKLSSNDTNKVVDSGNLNLNGNTSFSDQILLDYLKLNQFDSINLVTATLSLAAACSSAGIAVLYARDLHFCNNTKMHLPCVRFELSIAMAFITWFLIAVSSHVMFWILASV